MYSHTETQALSVVSGSWTNILGRLSVLTGQYQPPLHQYVYVFVCTQCHCHVKRNHLWSAVSRDRLLIGVQAEDDVSNYRWFTLRTYGQKYVSSFPLLLSFSLLPSFISQIIFALLNSCPFSLCILILGMMLASIPILYRHFSRKLIHTKYLETKQIPLLHRLHNICVTFLHLAVCIFTLVPMRMPCISTTVMPPLKIIMQLLVSLGFFLRTEEIQSSAFW